MSNHYSRATGILLIVTASLFTGACSTVNTNIPELDPVTEKAFERALGLLKKKHYKRATTAFQELVKTKQPLPGAYINLGLCYLHSKKYSEAADALNKAIELKPSSALAHTHLGLAYRHMGKLDAAKDAYLLAIKQDDNYTIAHLNLAILYDIYLGKLPLALQQYEIYQSKTDAQDKNIEKWIVDLKRRIKSAQITSGEKQG